VIVDILASGLAGSSRGRQGQGEKGAFHRCS
jgi:hypothetical protein